MEYRVITPSDREYPHKLKERLGDKSPEKLYYHGPLEFIDRFTMSVICSDESHGTELWETNQLLFTIREYDMNYIGSWHSVIETEIFRLALFKGYSNGTKRSKDLLLGDRTLTLFSAKGLNVETYESFLLDRFYPPLHEFPERNEYFRRAKEGELLMLSVCKPDETKQLRKNIMERNWIACVLGDIVFIPYGPKGSKTYITAKKLIETNIPVFTLDHPTCTDLHKLRIPGFNRNSIRSFLEDKGAKLPVQKNIRSDSRERYNTSENKAHFVKEPAQINMKFKK